MDVSAIVRPGLSITPWLIGLTVFEFSLPTESWRGGGLWKTGYKKRAPFRCTPRRAPRGCWVRSSKRRR